MKYVLFVVMVISGIMFSTVLNITKEESSTKTQLEKVYKKGANWLISQQDVGGGYWKDLAGKEDVSITALAILSLGSSKKYRREYWSSLKKGLEFIVKNQQNDGGFYQPDKTPVFVTYPTALSIVALKTLSPRKYNKNIRKAVYFLEKQQYSEDYKDIKPSDANYGGWAYGGKGKDADKVDLSNTSFTIEALRKSGLPKDSIVWKRVLKFISRTQNFSETSDLTVAIDDGGFVYAPNVSKAGEVSGPENKKGPKSYGSMTYAGLLSFIYSYVDKNDQRVQAAFSWIRKNFTLDENPGLATPEKPALGRQGLFYYYQVFAKALYHYGVECFEIPHKNPEKKGAQKICWTNALVGKLSSLQDKEGFWKNEIDRWWESYPVLTTEYSLIALNYVRKGIVGSR